MNSTITMKIKFLCLISTAMLCACTNQPRIFKENPNQLSMSDIYKMETARSSNAQLNDKALPSLTKTNYQASAQAEINKLNQQFKTLPNPQIALYIFPHRVFSGSEWVPVSGYTTAFHLYERDEFVLPGEALGQ